MRELSDDVLEEFQNALPDYATADTERTDPIEDRFVFIRPPNTIRNQPATLPAFRSGTLVVDVWAKRVAELHEMLDALTVISEGRFENGRAKNIHYKLESEVFDEEDLDFYHCVATYSFTYEDGRLLSG